MKKFFLAAAFAVVAASFVLHKYPSNEITQADHQVARNATWTVHCFGRPCGTAVQVKPGFLLTAAHITQMKRLPPKTEDGEEIPPRLTISKNGGETLYELETVYDDRTTDVALVRADTPAGSAVVPVADTEPSLGRRGISVGYPLLFTRPYWNRNEAMITEGLVQEKVERTGADNASFLRTTPAYVTSLFGSPGNSGGGLFVKHNGKLVVMGTVSGGVSIPDGPMSRYMFRRFTIFTTWSSVKAALMYGDLLERIDRLESAVDKTFPAKEDD